MINKKLKTHQYRFILLVVGVILVCCVAPFLGARVITPSGLADSLLDQEIFYQIRIPRVALGFLAGCTLAVCGAVFQAVFRNPLAEPFTLGVNGGASVGVALVVLCGIEGALLGMVSLSIVGAFLGGAVAIGFISAVSFLQRSTSNVSIILAGVAVSSLFSSILLVIQLVGDVHDSFQIIRMLMGGIEAYGYKDITIVLLISCAGFVFLFVRHRELDLLLVGDEIAISRGVRVRWSKRYFLITASIMVSGVISVCGPISFLGLMVPHICRIVFGPTHRTLLLSSALTGGTFLVVCDVFARVVFAPQELPVGIITSILGVPFFIWILLRRYNTSGVWS